MDGMKGKRVLITRAAEDCAVWASRLAAAGAVPLILPCIECRPIRNPAVEARLVAELPRADWLVLTSRRGAQALARLIEAAAWGAPGEGRFPDVRIAAVGPATAAAARALPGRVDLVAEGGTAESLARALAARLAQASGPRDDRPRMLIAVAENAGSMLEDVLGRAGGECIRINVYRTTPAAPGTDKRALSELGADKILLASPTAVAGLLNRMELDTAAEILTIGPSTSKAARAAGLTVTAEAAKPSLEGLMEAMA